jgi:hypothetical protein
MMTMDSSEVKVPAENEAAGDNRELPSSAEPRNDTEELQRIRALPKEVGALLMVAGIGGVLLPGPVGMPFLIVGGVILWPKAFERVELFFQKRFPKTHHQSVRQMKRFLDDLDRRYPLAK